MQDPSASRKRFHEDGTASIQESLPYKIRAVVRDLRPHFIEVLKTPDFRNCKAANDIREGMKLLIDLYKELVEQSIKRASCSNGDIKPPEHQRNVNPVAEHQPDVKPAVIHPPQNGVPTNLSDNHVQGSTFVIGGSAFGWNFITYNGPDAVYYGRTKEAYRVTNPKSE